jgi:glycogenin glucosyltransferase
MEWDATRGAPPVESKPEAANFPTTTYEFSTDLEPFVPPAAYPEPPKDMWYEVPKGKPKQEQLVPIFPWEERDVPKPTRRFIEEEKQSEPEPEPEPEPELEFAGADELEVQSEFDRSVEPKTPTIHLNDSTPWSAFGASSKNAWDEVSGIEDYVRALTRFQKNRGNVQVLQNEPSQTNILSPTNEPSAEELIEKVQNRRESLILTDFPSAVERPSLPVTPAPIRRSTFWGAERDEEGELPPAEGVPDQADWVCPNCGFVVPLATVVDVSLESLLHI